MPKNIREFTPEEKIQRAYDMIQIKNVMGRHAYLHACNRHDIEMEICWAHKAPNISWGNAGGFQVGRDVVWSFYVRPHIGHGPKPGEGQMHTLTTPLIEIAGDGQTAQAMWYTPGYICGHGGPMDPDDAPLDGQWMYERYAIDFIKEDGEWKIWHFFVGTDFSFSAGTKYEERQMGPAPKRPPQYGVMRIPGLYTSRYNWSQYPHWPVPYETWTPEISYGPEAFMKEGE